MIRSFVGIWLKRAFPLFVLLCLAQAGRATMVVIPSDDDLVVGARSIVIAKVTGVQCGLDERNNEIFTYTSLKLEEVLKGQFSSRKIVIKQMGGEAGNRVSVIFGTPQFTVGEEVLLYLDTWQDGSLRVHQMFLGKFSISRDAASGQMMVERGTSGAHVVTLPGPDGLTPGGAPSFATSRMELSSYKAMVRSKVAAQAERSREFETAHYAGIPQLAEPAEYRSSAGSRRLQPQFHLFSPAMRWFEPDSGQTVFFDVNLDGAPNSQVVDDVAAAGRAWSSIPGCALRVAAGNTISACATNSPRSVIFFNNCLGIFSATPSCSGILALGGIQGLNSFATKVVSGQTFVQITVGYVSFNPWASCYFGNHCNVQEVLTHEMGHALGLHHSWQPPDLQPGVPPFFGPSPSATDSDATMYYMAHFDGRCASVRTDDINAMLFVYPGVGGPPGPLGITSPGTIAGGTTGQAYSQSLSASGGTPPYTWSLAPGSGPLPPGLTLSPSGAISGTPTSAGTFNSTVQVRDSIGATSQSQISIRISPPNTSGDAAQFVSQSVPTSLQTGQKFNVVLSWINTGTEAWSDGTGFVLVSQNPPNNTTWGGGAMSLQGYIISPGYGVTFLATALAPTTAGVYNFQWQMMKQGAGFFGDPSPNVAITVGQPTPPSVVTSTLPGATMGSAFSAQLAATGGQPPYVWGVSAGVLPGGLALDQTAGVISGTPNAAGTFGFAITVRDQSLLMATKELQIQVIAPVPVPRIESLRYRSGGGKLFVTGSNFDLAATLLVDGTQVVPRISDVGLLVAKRLFLSTGTHQIQVVNTNGTISPAAVLTVD